VRRRTAAAVVLAVALVGACGESGGSSTGRQAFGTFAERAFRIESPDGEPAKVCCALIADDDRERHRGMRERQDFGGYDGMVFVYETDSYLPYTMSTVPIPLSIAWFDASGGFLDSREMEPCPSGDGCPGYPPPQPYRYALEVQGPDGLAPLGVGPGARLVLLDEPCPKAG
jgi:uncharacterized protein